MHMHTRARNTLSRNHTHIPTEQEALDDINNVFGKLGGLADKAGQVLPKKPSRPIPAIQLSLDDAVSRAPWAQCRVWVRAVSAGHVAVRCINTDIAVDGPIHLAEAVSAHIGQELAPAVDP